MKFEEITAQERANKSFPHKEYDCPFCYKPIRIFPGVNLNAPLPGDAYILQCYHCFQPYYLSWLGPWDMNEATLEGFRRREREKKFSERMLNLRAKQSFGPKGRNAKQ